MEVHDGTDTCNLKQLCNVDRERNGCSGTSQREESWREGMRWWCGLCQNASMLHAALFTASPFCPFPFSRLVGAWHGPSVRMRHFSQGKQTNNASIHLVESPYCNSRCYVPLFAFLFTLLSFSHSLACTLDVIGGGMGMGEEECDVDGEVDVQVQFQRHMPSSLCPMHFVHCPCPFLTAVSSTSASANAMVKSQRQCHRTLNPRTWCRRVYRSWFSFIPLPSSSHHQLTTTTTNKRLCQSFPWKKGDLIQGPLNLIRGPSLISNLQVRLHKGSEMRVKEYSFIDRREQRAEKYSRIQTIFIWVCRSVCPL